MSFPFGRNKYCEPMAAFVKLLISVAVGMLRMQASVVIAQLELSTRPEVKETIFAAYCTRDYECGYGCGLRPTSSSCSCHPACEVFRDCCYNTLEQSKRCFNTNDTEHFISDVLPKVQEYFQCTTDVISNSKYWMISKCPNSWSGANECDVSSNETEVFVGRLEDNLSGIPVLSRTGLTYRNVFCALCHGEDLSVLTPWSFNAENCEDNEMFGAATNLTTKDLILLLKQKCDSVSFLPPKEHQHYSLSVIPCGDVGGNLIDQCDDNTASMEIQFECSSIAAPISIGGILFKNKICVECFYSSRPNFQIEILEFCRAYHEDGFPEVVAPIPCFSNVETGEAFCPTPPQPPPLVPISITFNFGTNSGGVSVQKSGRLVQDTSIKCDDEGFVFDPLESKCKQLSCPDGFILRDMLCVQLPNITGNYSEVCGHFVITMTAKSMNFGNNSCLEDMKIVFSCLPLETVLLLYSSIDYYNVSCRLAMDGELVVETNTSSLDIIESLLNRNENKTVPRSCKDMDIIELTAYCSSLIDESILRCDSEWLNETHWIRSDNISEGILLNNSSESIELSQIKVRHSFQFSPATSSISPEAIYVTLCHLNLSEISTCPKLILDSDQFLASENDSAVLLYAQNTSIQLTPDMYTILQNGSIEVCNFFTDEGSVTVFSFLPRYSNLQSILSTVGIVLSLFGLFITFVSYCLFPALRTRLANILIMTLCGCLIVAQLFLLFAGIATTSPILCSLVSGLGHFFWLTAFSSSSILGFLMDQTFGLRNQTLRGKKPSKKSICLFVLLCFVPPALISGALLVLYYTDKHERHGIVYGSTSGCWIGGPMINLYAFGIPVAISLFINLIFFIHITVSIYVQKRQSEQMRKSQEDSYIRELVIYSKIFIILGLTWISGFFAALFDQPWLWYLFIIFTAFQGVFIFLAFTVKSQIWGMWRKRLSGYTSSYSTSSRSTNNTSGGMTKVSAGTITTPV